VHIIGICGTAMAALAGMLKSRGIAVTGSDAMAYPPVSDLLADLGIPIMKGYRAENLDHRPDLVVVGNVCRRDNPEAVRVREQGMAHASLPEVLRLVFMAGKSTVVPTGTHGKTTTCSLVAWLLMSADRDPSYMIGGVPANFGSNYRLGDGDVFVVEGDEYDTAYFDKVPKFWHYPANVASINNLEFDHADIYGSVDEIEAVFARFASEMVADDGVLWVNGDDERAVRAASHASALVRTFGLGRDCYSRAAGVTYDESGTAFDWTCGASVVARLHSPLWGEHNLRNALGAVNLAYDAGVSVEAIVAGLPEFLGVAKRQQTIGEAAGVLVIDDFAHHPTAVRETLRALRGRYPDRRIWAVFEAKSNTSRRAVFQDDYPPAFDSADRVVLSQPWKNDNLPESERISIPRVVDTIRERGTPVDLIPDVDAIVDFLADEVREGDIVAGLSGSDFGGLHHKLVARLSHV